MTKGPAKGPGKGPAKGPAKGKGKASPPAEQAFGKCFEVINQVFACVCICFPKLCL